jgi:hypothetical protein
MPRLLFLVPCDKVLTDEENLLSIITVLETVNISVPLGQELPRDAMATNPWHVVIQWLTTREEAQKEYEHKLQIFAPDGNEFGGSITRFTVTEQLHRHVAEIPGFPIGVEGECVVKLTIREVGTEEWSPVIEYPIHIAHETAQEAVEEQNAGSVGIE